MNTIKKDEQAKKKGLFRKMKERREARKANKNQNKGDKK